MFAVRDEVWVMRGNGEAARPIRIYTRRRRGSRWVFPPTDHRGAHYGIASIDISNDGSRLLIAKGGQHVFILDAAGEMLRQVRVSGASITPYTGSDTAGAQFSPDGKRVIAHFKTPSREGIGTVSVHGGRVKLIHTKRHALAPTYSDDGRWIAFSAIGPSPEGNPSSEGGRAIWLMRSDGRRERRIAARRGLNFDNPDFSPDGRQIVFENTIGPRVIGRESTVTYAVDVNGGPLRRVARGAIRFSVGNPEWVR